MTFKGLINALPIASREIIADCPVCQSKIHNDGKSWISLSTGVMATYWMVFCTVVAVCILYPNDGENGIIDDQWMNLRGRRQTNDLFHIFDHNAYTQM